MNDAKRMTRNCMRKLELERSLTHQITDLMRYVNPNDISKLIEELKNGATDDQIMKYFEARKNERR